MVLGFRRSSSNQVGAIPPRKTWDRGLIAPRSGLDRGSIGPRSWGSSLFCLRRPMTKQLDGRSRLTDPVHRDRDVDQPSDEASGEWTVRSRSIGLSF